MPVSDAMTQALADLKAAHEAAIAKAATGAVGPAVDAKDAEDVSAVQALTAEITPPA